MNGVVGKNIVWLLISQSATWVVSLVTLILTPDLLGTDGFGAYSFAVIFVQYFALLAGFETGQLLVRLVAQDHGIVGKYVYNALLLKVVAVVVLSAIALAVAVLLGLDRQLVVLIAIGCGGMLLSNLNFVLQSALGGMHRMARPAMWAVVQLYVGGVLGIGVLVLGGDVVAYAAVIALTGLIPLVANYRQLRPQITSERSIDLQVWKTLMTGGLPLLTLTALNQFYGSIDFPVLEWLAGRTTVGWYAVAYRWAAIPVFICTAVVAASFPRFAEYGKDPGPLFAQAVNRAVWLTVVVSAPCAFILASVADDLVATFHNPEYAGSVPPLRILALQVPIAAVDTVLATALVASNRFRKYIFVALTAAVLTPVALYFTIHAALDGSGNGATGAALVTTFTEVFVFSGAWLMRSKGVFDRGTTWRCVAAVLAASLIPLVLWPLDDLPLPAKVVLAMVVYVLAILALRGVTLTEIRDARAQVQDIIRRRRGTAPELVADDAP